MTPASDTLAHEQTTSQKGTCDVTDMTAMIFDATMLRLLECGDIHLGTDYERELRDTIVACACARAGGIDAHSMPSSVRMISDLPIRLEREMERLLRVLCVPRMTTPHPCRSADRPCDCLSSWACLLVRMAFRSMRNTLSFVASAIKLA